jgi:mono/diheme cytochrome c family protein
VILIALVVAGFSVYVASRQHLTFDAPMPAVAASTDSAVIERGRYVVRDLASCTICHGDPKQHENTLAGEEVPLSGGFEFNIPPGRFHPRNITPDEETGIGRFSDGAIARALRYGVRHDGRALLPFMEMQGLSDEDLVAVVSYLRSQPPVRNVVPAHQFSLLGRIVKATVLANPVGPKETPPRLNPHGPTVENGRYLVESVANCWACHTQRDFKTGAMVGPHLGGRTCPTKSIPSASGHRPISPPSPPPGDSRAHRGSVHRAHARRTCDPGSPMPWQGFRNLNEDDLRAIYRYLKTVPPVVHDTGPPFVDKS